MILSPLVYGLFLGFPASGHVLPTEAVPYNVLKMFVFNMVRAPDPRDAGGKSVDCVTEGGEAYLNQRRQGGHVVRAGTGTRPYKTGHVNRNTSPATAATTMIAPMIIRPRSLPGSTGGRGISSVVRM